MTQVVGNPMRIPLELCYKQVLYSSNIGPVADLQTNYAHCGRRIAVDSSSQRTYTRSSGILSEAAVKSAETIEDGCKLVA